MQFNNYFQGNVEDDAGDAGADDDEADEDDADDDGEGSESGDITY